MKKTLLLFLAMAGCIATAAAQDMIIKRDASRIEARVTEISPAEVRYKRFSNPDGPTYVLPVSEIAAIRYANGEEERFAVVAKAAAPQPPADVRYAVGDYYERDGVQGIVVEIDEEGRHGKILSLDQAMLPWTLFRKPDLRTVGTDDQGDGRVNMATMERYIEANGLSWSDFPAFEWCRNKGEGWYLPAINEMLIVGSSYHGGVRSHSDRKARNNFNETLRSHGGQRMDRMLYYFTSTEKNDREAWTSHMELEAPYVVEIPKHNKFLVRALRRF